MKMRPIDAQRWMQPRLGRAWPRRVHHAMVKAGRAGHLVGDTVELNRRGGALCADDVRRSAIASSR